LDIEKIFKFPNNKKEAPISVCIFLLVVGLLLGTVFTFFALTGQSKVTREECEVVETEFLSLETRSRLRIDRFGTIEETYIICSNGEDYLLRYREKGTYDALLELHPQDEITLLLHPNSGHLLQISSNSKIILPFEKANSANYKEGIGFIFLGLFMYGCTIYGLCYMIRIIGRKRRMKQRYLAKMARHKKQP
jgi:uncharacterized integral membrane protein